MINIVKDFSIVNEAEVDVLLDLLCFLHDPVKIGNLISGFSASSKPSLYIWKFLFQVSPKKDIDFCFVHFFLFLLVVRTGVRSSSLFMYKSLVNENTMSTELGGSLSLLVLGLAFQSFVIPLQ